MRVEVFPLGPLMTNCFVAAFGGQAVAVDAGGPPQAVLRYLETAGLTLTQILVTHLHFDHLLGIEALRKATGAAVLAPEADGFLLESELGAGGFMDFPEVEPFTFDPVALGEMDLLGQTCRVLPTPGHTPGSVSYYFPDAGCVFVGDLIFHRSVGRTDFPGGDMGALKRSVIERIFSLPGATVIYPGHGDPTTVDEEKLHNPFFSAFEERA